MDDLRARVALLSFLRALHTCPIFDFDSGLFQAGAQDGFLDPQGYILPLAYTCGNVFCVCFYWT